MRRSGAKWPWAVLVSCFVLAGLAPCGCKGKGTGAPAGDAEETEEAEAVEVWLVHTSTNIANTQANLERKRKKYCQERLSEK